MTKGEIIYWLSTSLLCLIYAAGAAMYLAQRPMVEEGFGFLGYPTYLITLLIVVKIAAPLAILTRVSVQSVIWPMQACSFTWRSPSRPI